MVMMAMLLGSAPRWALSQSTAPTTEADPSERRFLNGLRERRLFALAEKYCQDRLQRANLPAARRVELLVELSRTHLDQARSLRQSEREKVWLAATDGLDEELRQRLQEPRRVLLETQRGLVQLARGELALQEAEVTANNDQPIAEARQQLRAAIGTLKKVADETATQLRQSKLRPGEHPDALSTVELESLQRNVNYQLARAYLLQGRSYPAASADRVAAVEQAVALLTPLTQMDTVEPLAWQAQLDEIVGLRLLQDDATAARRLAKIEEQNPPPEIALDVRAERVRLALAAGRVDEALRLVQAGREIKGETSAQLDLAILETIVAAWRVDDEAKRVDDAKAWQAKGTDMLRTIDALYGPYWSRRAETLLAGSIAGSTATDDVALLVRAAEGYYRAGQIDQAVATYDRAATQAIAAKDENLAFDAAFTAAALEQERQQFAVAADRYRRLALSLPKHPRASEAHLLAIYGKAQTLNPPTDAAVAEYAAMLGEQLQHWPTAKTADQARLWLGRLRQGQGDWPAAVAAYRGIAPDREAFATAVEDIAQCYDAWLHKLRDESKPTGELATEAASFFEKVITGGADRLPERWSPLQQVAALAAARTWLLYTTDHYDRAERIVSAALGGSPDASEGWKQEARALVAYALAGQGRRNEAAQAIEQLGNASPAQLLALMEGLSRVGVSASSEVRRELAELTLRAADVIGRAKEPLVGRDRQRFDLLTAQAWEATGQTEKARAALKTLAEANPKDAAILEEYATVLSSGENKASIDAALDLWRKLEQGSKTASERWFRAKYQLALLHARLGDRERAEQIISVTQVLHPDLGGPEMKGKFLELLGRVQKK